MSPSFIFGVVGIAAAILGTSYYIQKVRAQTRWNNALAAVLERNRRLYAAGFTDDFGNHVVNIHDRRLCEGRPCVIHNPSDHPMRSFRLLWRQAGPFDIKPSHFERICEHGVGHPDPDDLWYWINVQNDPSMGVHGCDGCCKLACSVCGALPGQPCDAALHS